MIILTVALTMGQTSATPVDPATAMAAAQNFMQAQSSTGGRKAPAKANVNLIHAEKSAANANQPVYYIFNTEEGFIIISGDDRAREVLAHGDNPLDLNDIPENMKFWLEGYKRQLEYLLSHPTYVVHNQARRAPKRELPHVEPLLTAMWDQSSPYYNECPSSGGNRCVTGCAATSLAMVFHYWKHPVDSTPSVPRYTTSSLKLPLAALPPTVFDWNNMLDVYRRGNYSNVQGSAVAHLMRYIGQAEEMDYTPDGSGSYGENILEAVRLFGYEQDASLVMKDTWWGSQVYDDNEWAEIIQEELYNDRPIVMCAYTQSAEGLSGHAFDVDGYDPVNDTYHVNWGWSGRGNAFYALNAFSYSGMTFNIMQQLVIGIEPPATGPTIRTGRSTLRLEAYEDSTVCGAFTLKGTFLTEDVHLTLHDDSGVFGLETQQISPDKIEHNTPITVTYSPKAVGEHQATITLSSEGADDKTIILEGTCILETYTPTTLEVTNVDEMAINAEWEDHTPEKNVMCYNLQMAPGKYYELRLTESFNKNEYEGISTSDWSNKLDEITDQPGWNGSKIYRSGTDLIIGSSKSKGWLETPPLDMFYNQGTVTVRLNAKCTGSETSTPLKISCGNNDTTVFVTEEDQEHWILLPCRSDDMASVTFSSLTGKRVVLCDVSIYAGDRYTPVDETLSSTVIGITGTSYEMENVKPGYYAMRVQGVFIDGSQSDWTKWIPFTVNWMHGDVNHDGEINIADINQVIEVIYKNHLLASLLRVNDVNHDGEVNISDINEIINEILEDK